MNSSKYKNSISQLREKLNWVIEYTSTLESDEKFKTRLCDLGKLLEPIEANSDGDRLLTEMNSSDLFYPTHEILVLYDIFKYVSRLQDTSSLKRLVRNILKEKADPRDDQSNAIGRDQQFEIQIAIHLSKANWRITGYEDVETLSRSGIPISFQCKRPRNADTLRPNLMKALNQLKDNNGVGDRCYGVAVMNLDLIYSTNTRHYLDASDYQIKVDYENIKKHFIESCTPILIQRDNEKILGALGFLTFLRWDKSISSLLIINNIISCPKPGSRYRNEQMGELYKALCGSWAYGETDNLSNSDIRLMLKKNESNQPNSLQKSKHEDLA